MSQNHETDHQTIDKETIDAETIDTEKQGRHFPINIHFIFLAAIVLIIGFSAYRLYRWNQGEQVEYDPNADTSEFDVEAMDNIIPLAPDKLEGREDDGVTTILCLGDDPFPSIRARAGSRSRLPPRPARPYIMARLPALPLPRSMHPTMTDILWMLFLSPMWRKVWRQAIST